jgi:hypothetical protein
MKVRLKPDTTIDEAGHYDQLGPSLINTSTAAGSM